MNDAPTPPTDDEVEQVARYGILGDVPIPSTALLDRFQSTEDYVRLGKRCHQLNQQKIAHGQ
jgi:hypothetical protein